MAKKGHYQAPGMVYSPRTFTAPIAALVMAGVLYMYSVTSIRAAKRNAQLHREADGGQLDMRRESLRRHGVLGKVEGTGGLQLFRDTATEGTAGKETAAADNLTSKDSSPATTSSSTTSTSRRPSKSTKGEVGGGGNTAVRYGELEKREGEGGQRGLLGKSAPQRTEIEAQLQEHKGRGKLRELGTKVLPEE